MHCTNCGAELYPGDRFCMRCGARAPEEPAPIVQPEHPEAQPPPPPPPLVEAVRLQAQPPPPPPPVFVTPQPAAPPPKKGSGRKWVIVGFLGLLAVACVVVALSGAWLMGRLSRTGELTIAEPTSTPRLAATPRPTLPSTPTQEPVATATSTVLPATPTTAPAPTAQGGVELFSCTSADLDCGWTPYSDETREVYAVGPELFLVAKGPLALVETEIPGVLVQDFYLHFVARLSSSQSEVGSYSAAFRCDPADSGTFSYEFELFASGEYRVWQWVDYGPTTLDSGMTDLDPSAENSIEVFAQGPSVSFLVNGEPVTEITDAELREGPIHLIATVHEDADIEVAISEVVVEGQGSPSPRPSSTTAPTSVPPSPTPTRPAPTAVPPSPTPTRGPVEFDPIIFAQELDAEGYPIMPSTTFPPGTTVVSSVFAFRGMYPGLELQAIWYHNGQEYYSYTHTWTTAKERGHWGLYLDKQDGGPLPSGNYRLELYVEGRLLQSGTFTIQ